MDRQVRAIVAPAAIGPVMRAAPDDDIVHATAAAGMTPTAAVQDA